MFFAEYSLLAMFDAYPASKCTSPNIYKCVCAGLVVIVLLRTALGLLKEEERKMNNLRGRRFRFTTLETSVSLANSTGNMCSICKNCAFYDKSMKLCMQLEWTFINITGYRGISNFTCNQNCSAI